MTVTPPIFSAGNFEPFSKRAEKAVLKLLDGWRQFGIDGWSTGHHLWWPCLWRSQKPTAVPFAPCYGPSCKSFCKAVLHLTPFLPLVPPVPPKPLAEVDTFGSISRPTSSALRECPVPQSRRDARPESGLRCESWTTGAR